MTDQKLIFLDIDGTVLDAGDVVWPSTAKAIAAAREKGHRLFLCTGREQCFVPEPVLALGLTDGVFGAGANAICDGRVIYRQAFQPEQYDRMCQLLTRHRAHFVLETLGRVVAFEPLRAVDPDYWRWLEQMGVVTLPRPEPGWSDVDKAVFFGADCSLEQLAQELGPDFYLIPASYRISGEGGELQQPEVSKATGIQKILEELGADRADTIGFGDGINDLEMLEFCQESVAMGNAPDRVKAAATMVTEDIQRDGLWLAFRRLGLID